MTTAAAGASAECGCWPAPADLPAVLLSVTVDDPTLTPTLTAFTVDYELRCWRADALARHIVEWVLDYALRYSDRRPLSPGRAVAAARQAVHAAFGDLRDRGVPGEILLHAVCRQFFHSDTVINKVWFKTAANDTYKGFDAVHCVHEGDQLQLWLGEAKFYSNVRDAIRSALRDLHEHLNSDYLRQEFLIIADKIDDDHPHAVELRQLMHPNTSLDVAFDKIVVPVLVTYDSQVTAAHSYDCMEYRSELESEVRTVWNQFSHGADTSLPVDVRLLLVPLATKADVLAALEREVAISWR